LVKIYDSSINETVEEGERRGEKYTGWSKTKNILDVEVLKLENYKKLLVFSF